MSLLRVLKLEFAPPLSLHAWVYPDYMLWPKIELYVSFNHVID
jgi:hypothetical protein